METLLSVLLPATAGNTIYGMKLPVYVFTELVPFMYTLLILETLLRMLVGHMRPVIFAHTPPGAIGDYVILPVATLMLVLSLWRQPANYSSLTQ